MRGFVAAAAALAALAALASDPLAPRSKGSVTAPVTVYEMGDFQCPACRGFAETTLPALDREYIRTGKVRWIFINLPLTEIHPNALIAAEAALCAARQEKFWPMHDLLYHHQPDWAPLPAPRDALVALGGRAGLDQARLRECLRSGATRSEVEQDAQRARRSGARSTPTFYIEGGLLVGAAPVAVFRQVLDSVYRVRTAPRR